MKKVIAIVLCVVCVFVLLCGPVQAATKSIRYEAGVVSEYDAEQGIVYVVGATGNVWGYYGNDNVGQRVVLKIDNNNTPQHEDDEVVDVFIRVR